MSFQASEGYSLRLRRGSICGLATATNSPISHNTSRIYLRSFSCSDATSTPNRTPISRQHSTENSSDFSIRISSIDETLPLGTVPPATEAENVCNSSTLLPLPLLKGTFNQALIIGYSPLKDGEDDEDRAGRKPTRQINSHNRSNASSKWLSPTRSDSLERRKSIDQTSLMITLQEIQAVETTTNSNSKPTLLQQSSTRSEIFSGSNPDTLSAQHTTKAPNSKLQHSLSRIFSCSGILKHLDKRRVPSTNQIQLNGPVSEKYAKSKIDLYQGPSNSLSAPPPSSTCEKPNGMLPHMLVIISVHRFCICV